MQVRSLLTVLLTIAASFAASAQEKGEDPRVKVVIHLSAEHAPETIKANTRADLSYVVSSTRTKKGKFAYSTKRVAQDLEVLSVKREEKPDDPAKAVLVELRVSKEQAAKIEKLKTQIVSIVGRDASGNTVMRKQPVPLRLEPAKPAKE